MKVLHLISGGDKGGAKTHVFTLLMSLQENIDVTVICFMDGVFYREIQNMPIKSILIKQKYRNDLTIIKPLIKHIIENRYNIIHSHGARANFISMFLKNRVKIPILTTVHSDYKLDFTENLYKKYIYTGINILALKFIDYYIAVSNNFKNMLVDRGFKKDNIYTVYNTIDFEKTVNFIGKKEFCFKYAINADDKILVGIIGRFDQVKGHSVFINAAYEVLKTNKNILFILAGEGPEENNLRQLAKKLKIENNIIFTGFIEDIFSFINAIDINVLTSYSESFPYVLLEGALMKKATISTAVGGVTDLIKDGETGFLAESGDYEQIAKKIINFAENKELRDIIGINLYEYAKIRFSRESMKFRHLEIYNNILEIEKANNKNFDVVLSGYYGFDNSGDDALLKAVVDSLRAEKENIKILVLSKKPSQTMEEHNVFAINRHNFFQIFKYLKMCRVFIYGGGSLIQDITSTKSIVYYITLLKIAKKYGLKLMIYGNGIGPIIKKKNIERVQKSLVLCDYISLREPESLNELNRLGINVKKTALSVDPAFVIEPKEASHVLEYENIRADKNYFCVNLRSWRYNEPNFTDKIAKLIKMQIEKNFIPIYIAMHPSDYNILKEVITKVNSRHILLSKVYDIGTLMSIIKESKFIVAMRLHSLIYAISVGVPAIGLAYDPKVSFFLEYAHQKTYVSTKDIDIKLLNNMIDDILENYAEKVKLIKERASYLKSLSEKDSKIAISLLD